MAGLLSDYLQIQGGGSSSGAGGSFGITNLPLWEGATGGANINGIYSPQGGLLYNGFGLTLQQMLDKQKQHELMLRYGQDAMQNQNYGVQYKYSW